MSESTKKEEVECGEETALEENRGVAAPAGSSSSETSEEEEEEHEAGSFLHSKEELCWQAGPEASLEAQAPQASAVLEAVPPDRSVAEEKPVDDRAESRQAEKEPPLEVTGDYSTSSPECQRTPYLIRCFQVVLRQAGQSLPSFSPVYNLEGGGKINSGHCSSRTPVFGARSWNLFLIGGLPLQSWCFQTRSSHQKIALESIDCKKLACSSIKHSLDSNWGNVEDTEEDFVKAFVIGFIVFFL